MKPVILAIVIPMVLAGCATTAPLEVNVVGDTFCKASHKRSWSVDDTPASIEEAIRINAGIDKACGSPGKHAKHHDPGPA